MEEMNHEHTHEHEHAHGHTHEHTHADGTTHTHEHTHGGDHQHTHGTEGSAREEAVALLSYMVDHNRHHAEELHELAHSFDEETAGLIHEALKDLNAGNDKLAKALEAVKKG